MKTKGYVFGRIIVTTTTQSPGAPLVDTAFTRDADGNRYKGWALLLTPWRRNKYRESLPQKALVVGLRTALLVACLFATPLIQTGCANRPPSARVIEVQTLKSIGQSAEASVALSAQLYRDHRITPEQARQVLDFYNLKYLPAFRFAVGAVQANLDSIASPAVVDLANQLAVLVASFLPKPTL